jgi:transposase
VVRYIGMDVHREFEQPAVVEDGLVRDEGRIAVTPEALRSWLLISAPMMRLLWRPR